MIGYTYFVRKNWLVRNSKWIKPQSQAEVHKAIFTYSITFIDSIKKLKYFEINLVYLFLIIPEPTACHMDFLRN
jgi:hypothetical protein